MLPPGAFEDAGEQVTVVVTNPAPQGGGQGGDGQSATLPEGFPVINEALLYGFVHSPAQVSTNFFGLLDLLSPHHIVLALLVGAEAR